MATLWRREGLHSRPLRKDFHNQRSECLYIQVVHEAGFYLLICFEIEERLCVCVCVCVGGVILRLCGSTLTKMVKFYTFP